MLIPSQPNIFKSEKTLTKPDRIREDWEWDEDLYLKEMEEWGIDMQILALPLPCVYFEDSAKIFGSEHVVFGSDFPFGLGQEGMQPYALAQIATRIINRMEVFS